MGYFSIGMCLTFLLLNICMCACDVEDVSDQYLPIGNTRFVEFLEWMRAGVIYPLCSFPPVCLA